METLFPPDYPDRPDAPLLSFGPSFSEEIARSVVQAIWHENSDQPHETDIRSAAGLTMLEAFHPRDQLECMLAAQGVATHCAIMESLRSAMLPDTPHPVAIKQRSTAVQLNRMFSTITRDLERLQSKPLPQRPKKPDASSASGPPPDDDPNPGEPAARSAVPTESDPASKAPRARRSSRRAATKAPPERYPAEVGSDPGDPPRKVLDRSNPPLEPEPDLDDVPDLPEDRETRPDGTPGNLTAYAPKRPVAQYIPREAPIMVALATRPKPWRMVNVPPDQANPAQLPIPPADPVIPGPDRDLVRGPIDLRERIFTGDALSRFASARFDPDAPVEPLHFDNEDSVVELELISTGGDPEAEAERQAMMAAHPEGKPIVTFRHGVRSPPAEPPPTPTPIRRDDTPPDT